MDVVVKGNFDGALKFFKERVQKDGILKALKERSAYVKPGDRKRRKIFLAQGRKKKAARRLKRFEGSP